MPDPIPNSNVSADRIRSDWGIDGQFSMNSFRGKTHYLYDGNPNNNNYPYGIKTYPSSPIKFSDFILTIPVFTIDICIISGGGGGGGNVWDRGAGGGGAGGSVFFTSVIVPDGSGNNLKGWNTIYIAVGGGGSGGGNNVAGSNGGYSYLQYDYITPSASGYTTRLNARAGGAGGGGGGYDGQSNTITFTTPSFSHTGNGGGGGASYRPLGVAYSPRSGSAGTGERGGGQGLYVSSDSRNLFLSHGGGGGGSGGNGISATENKAGNGGPGTDLTWFLGSQYTSNPVMGGGGGGASYYNKDGTVNPNLHGIGASGSGGNGGTMGRYADHGTENRGGGGGGSTSLGNVDNVAGKGGNGGSGVVFIRYANDRGVQKMTGGEVTTILNNAYYLHTFKSSGVIHTLYT